MEISLQYSQYIYQYHRNKINTIPTKNTKNLFQSLAKNKSNVVFIKELLCNTCFDNIVSKKVFFTQDFSGYYKEQKIPDIEKTVVNYKKCFALLRFFDFFKLQILFLGKPLLSELFLKNLSLKSRHIFLLNEDWLFGFLTKCAILLF
jgi:hypothetical protein